jgi:hypothetical protein
MKHKTKVVPIVLFLSASIMLASLGNKKVEWKGKIEKENGITVIKNPREPLYGEIKFELEEDLSIGNEEEENYIFYDVVNIAIDSEENIFVLDGGNCRIQKFDRDGNYIQTIGRRGQGPGEFENPSEILFDSENNICVTEDRKIHVFNSEGKLKKSIRLDFSFSSCGITREGNMLAQIFSFAPEEQTDDVVLINMSGKKLKTIASFPTPIVILRKGPGVMGGISNPYGPRLHFYPLNEGLYTYGYSAEYKLFVITSSGDISYIIEKEESPEYLTQKEKNKIIDAYMERQKKRRAGPKLSRDEIEKAYNFPKYKPFFMELLKDDKNHIYVSRFSSFWQDEEGIRLDMFAKEGYYLWIVKIPFFPDRIRSGHIYRAESDLDSGYLKVKRYKIKNWDQIKEGI